MARRQLVWIGATLGSLLLAAAGVVIYARDPETSTYWLNVALLAPLFGVVLYGLQRVLPTRAQWVAAACLAPLGAIAYLLWPNEQWWNYGALTAVPLVLLVLDRDDRLREERGSQSEAWYGGEADGPWGPP
jgi:hypothetical protein